jgi:hypothetical protein
MPKLNKDFIHHQPLNKLMGGIITLIWEGSISTLKLDKINDTPGDYVECGRWHLRSTPKFILSFRWVKKLQPLILNILGSNPVENHSFL